MSDKLVKVKLYGHLRKFGKEFELAVKTPAEAVRALTTLVPGFKAYLMEAEKKGIEFAVFNGKQSVNQEELKLGAKPEIRIATVYGGRKNGGAFQAIVGAILIAVAVFATGGLGAAFVATGWAGTAAWMGAAMVLGGILQMTTPQPSFAATSEDSENTAAYAFGGPVNTTAQGNPIGLLYGEREIGGAVISAGIFAENRT